MSACSSSAAEPATATTEPRIVILRSAEDYDPRGRTQSYQAFFGPGGRSRRSAPVHPDQGDLFAELDEAERVASEEVGENVTVGSDGPDDDLDSVEDADRDESPSYPSPESGEEGG